MELNKFFQALLKHVVKTKGIKCHATTWYCSADYEPNLDASIRL